MEEGETRPNQNAAAAFWGQNAREGSGQKRLIVRLFQINSLKPAGTLLQNMKQFEIREKRLRPFR